jgi:hypothetical protein
MGPFEGYKFLEAEALSLDERAEFLRVQLDELWQKLTNGERAALNARGVCTPDMSGANIARPGLVNASRELIEAVIRRRRLLETSDASKHFDECGVHPDGAWQCAAACTVDAEKARRAEAIRRARHMEDQAIDALRHVLDAVQKIPVAGPNGAP